MKKVILTKGLPASGKTTWALNTIARNPGVYKRINKDDLRSMLDGNKYSKDNEKFILKLRDEAILLALDSGKHVIVDDTNLHERHITRIKELTKGLAAVEVKFFDIPLEECIRRDYTRENPVGANVIRDMSENLLQKEVKPTTIQQDPNLPMAIIVDIDGTIAKMVGRKPYDWARVGEDTVNQPIVDILLKYEMFGFSVILVSGRDAVCRSETEQWLADHSIPNHYLYMRQQGSREKDCIVKTKIYEKNIKNKFNVLFVLDDRNQTVDNWRDLGLTCLQVAPGNF